MIASFYELIRRSNILRLLLLSWWLLIPLCLVLNLYIKLTRDADGLTALIGYSYIIPLMPIDYMNSRSLNIRCAASMTPSRHEWRGLFLRSFIIHLPLYQGYYGSLAIVLLVMIINLVYTITLDKFREIKY